MVKNGNGCKNPRNSLVAATFEKANTYVFAAPIIRDREVGGSNPLARPNLLRKRPLALSGLVVCDTDCDITKKTSLKPSEPKAPGMRGSLCQEVNVDGLLRDVHLLPPTPCDVRIQQKYTLLAKSALYRRHPRHSARTINLFCA
jgi:hypothetical protein